MAMRVVMAVALMAALTSGTATAEEWVVRGSVKILGTREGAYFKPCNNPKVPLSSLVGVTFQPSNRGCPAHSFSGLSADEPTAEEKKAAEAEAKAAAAEWQALQSLTQPK